MTDSEDVALKDMRERVQNVLSTLNKYRTRFPSDAVIESILTQIELVQSHLESGEAFTHRQKEDFTFNFVANTRLENDEALATELYSIRNYAAHSM